MLKIETCVEILKCIMIIVKTSKTIGNVISPCVSLKKKLVAQSTFQKMTKWLNKRNNDPIHEVQVSKKKIGQKIQRRMVHS